MSNFGFWVREEQQAYKEMDNLRKILDAGPRVVSRSLNEAVRNAEDFWRATTRMVFESSQVGFGTRS